MRDQWNNFETGENGSSETKRTFVRQIVEEI
jgi:hypothetical protein